MKTGGRPQPYALDKAATRVVFAVIWLIILGFAAGIAVARINHYSATHHGTPYRQVSSTHHTPSLHSRFARTVNHPCRTESSVNCYWNARTMGNHRGRSYYVTGVPGPRGIACVYYWRHPEQDYCS